MSLICPNKNLKEWKDLVNVVGEHEAYRDFMEYNGEIRTPEEVLAKRDPITGTTVVNSISIPRPVLQKQENVLEKRLVDSGGISKKNGILFVKQHGYAAAQKVVNQLYREYGYKIAEIKPITEQKTGAGGRRIYKVVLNERVAEPVPSQRPNTGTQASMFYREPVTSSDPIEYEENDPMIPKDPIELDPTEVNNAWAVEIANKIAQRLATLLGVDYHIISEQEAEMLTKDARTPWNGEPAFYIGAKVYFIDNRLTTDIVLHEFGHPLVRAISKQNPELFNNLYNKVLTTSEGATIIATVNDLYPELAKTDDLYKEEVIVRSLQLSAKNQLNSIPESKGFIDTIKNILYSIKQMLRKVFGKVKVENLDVNTSLDQLGKMLVNDSFQIDTELINQNDVAAYARDQKEFIDTLKKLEDTTLQSLTDKLSAGVSQQLDSLISNKDYKGMLDILKDQFGRNQLAEIKSNLSTYKTTLIKDIEKLKDDFNYVNSHMSNMTSSLFRLEFIAKNMITELENVSKNLDSVDNLHKINYYNKFIDYWKKYTAEGINELNQSGIEVNNPLYKLLTSIQAQLNVGDKIVKDVNKKGVRDILWTTVKDTAAKIDENYTELISHLEKKGASKIVIDGHKKRYEEVKITPEKLEQLLNGELGDAAAFNGFLEGPIYSKDPIIAGFSLFVKNNMTEVENKAQIKYNNFVKEVGPLLKEAGYNPSNVAELGKSITFIDNIGGQDDQGNFTQKQVYTFLNPFKDYRYELAKLVDEIDKEQASANKTKDYSKLSELRIAYKKHLRQFFHQEYKEEFYDREILFESPIGAEAAQERAELLNKVREVNETVNDELDEYNATEQLDQLWREYRQLYSSIDLNGNKKSGRELEKVNILKQHREVSWDFYEWKERPGVFQNALANFEQQLVDKGTPRDSLQFQNTRQDWIDKNTRTIIKPDFYLLRKEIFDKIQPIMAKLPSNIKNQVDITQAWNDINEAISGFRDQDGQPQGSSMSEGRIALVKERQEQINKAREVFAGFSGLTTLEMNELGQFFEKIKTGEKLSPEDRELMNELLSKKDRLGLNKFEKAELNALFAELAELQHKEATDYYVDIFNNYLTKLDTNTLFLETGSRIIDKKSADATISDHIINTLLSQSEDFKTWFEKNHIRKNKYNPQTQESEPTWERLHIWNVVKPNDTRFIETTDLKDDVGNTIERIKGVPTLKYFTRAVKDEWKTARIVGKTVDNLGKRGNFLPKSKSQGAPDNRYINQDYFDLEKENPKLFKAMEKIKEFHIVTQSDKVSSSRLYYDIPRFRLHNLEILQRPDGARSAITSWWDKVKSYFKHSEDDFEEGQNWQDKFTLVKADMFDNELSSIPIAGLYKLDLDQVSLDVTQSMMRYMLSGERQKKLIEMNPMAKALQSILTEQGVKDMTKVNKDNLLQRGVRTYITRKGRSVREQVATALIEREFHGQTNAGWFKDAKGLEAATGTLFKSAAFGFFAMNIPSALKNSFSAMVQNMIEASAGRYLNPITYHQGIAWSGKVSSQISFEIYKHAPKSLDIQLVEIFDPSSTRFQETYGQSISRSLFKDTVNMSWLYSPRKWTELNATLGLFGGMMYHQKINQTQPDGSTKEISYIDAWQLVDGQLTVKPGIDPSWNIGGKQYTDFRTLVQTVNNNLNGAFSKFDSPLASRFLVYRMIAFMRRYLPAMAANRWAPERVNVGLGENTRGFYLDALSAFWKTLSTAGKGAQWLSPREKRAVTRMFVEVGQLIGMTLIANLFFDWDSDDKDRYEKLRAKSGALPFPGVEDPNHPFEVSGFLSNQSLNLLMQIRAENQQWLPIPGLGLKDYVQALDWKSVMLGPTIAAYTNMAQDLTNAAVGNEAAYYKRDVGPYQWQKEESAKFWNHLAKTVGITGTTMDPVMAIKNFQSIQTRK